MKNLINFLKGICIGIANVIPGFSGGTMAVMMNIYDLFVYAFANIFNEFKKVVQQCWSLFLGIIIGILLALITIVKLLEVIPFITIMFFVGLILASIPSIAKKTKDGKIKMIDGICFVLAVALLVILPFLKGSDVNIQYNFGLYIILFLLGIICSSAMVIPGVSGSLVLMAFGYYTFVMTSIGDFLKHLFDFSSPDYWSRFLVLFFFAIGCLFGIVFISKLIGRLLKKYPKTVFVTILGLLIASPFSIIYATLKDYEVHFDFWTIFFSCISLGIGISLVVVANYFQKKNLKGAMNHEDHADNN